MAIIIVIIYQLVGLSKTNTRGRLILTLVTRILHSSIVSLVSSNSLFRHNRSFIILLYSIIDIILGIIILKVENSIINEKI